MTTKTATHTPGSWYLRDIHYRPSGGCPWCDCLQEAVDAELALSLKATTDVSKVTCKKCRKVIRQEIKYCWRSVSDHYDPGAIEVRPCRAELVDEGTA